MKKAKLPPSNTPTSRPHRCPSMSSPRPPRPTISGPPATGTGVPAGYYWILAPGVRSLLRRPLDPRLLGLCHNRLGFHRGFWGPHIGFYGGINYGFGYTGVGYHGGYWRGNNFYYNRSVNRVNTNITTSTTAPSSSTTSTASPTTAAEAASPTDHGQPRSKPCAAREPRPCPLRSSTSAKQHKNRQQFYNVNRGRPAMVAAPRPIAAQPGFTHPNPGNRPGQPDVRPGQEVRPGQPETRARPTGISPGTRQPPANPTGSPWPTGSPPRPT